ncbi:MAG: transposase [Cyclobacteriaceae bacterium]|nr:transposase [Cyclobacteriaceae bacterium]
MKERALLDLLFPEGILEYFQVADVVKKDSEYIIVLEELNIHPEQYQGQKLTSKGFLEPITIQDFPLRGKACFLKVKRRRWTNEDTGEIVMRNWDIVAKGTRMTRDFAIFLKGIIG